MTVATPRRRLMPPVYFLLSLIAAAALHRYLPLATLAVAPWRYFGAVPIALGLTLAAVAARSFDKHGTAIKPFDPSTALVTTGVYRFTRNPMYLGMLAVLLGVGWLLGSLGALLPLPVLAAILKWRFVHPEEVMLEQTFGEPYLSYRRKVRRWL